MFWMTIVFVVALEHTVLILKHVLIAPLEGTPRNHRMAALVRSRAALARLAPIFWTKELRIFPPAHRALMATSLLKVVKCGRVCPAGGYSDGDRTNALARQSGKFSAQANSSSCEAWKPVKPFSKCNGLRHAKRAYAATQSFACTNCGLSEYSTSKASRCSPVCEPGSH